MSHNCYEEQFLKGVLLTALLEAGCDWDDKFVLETKFVDEMMNKHVAIEYNAAKETLTFQMVDKI